MRVFYSWQSDRKQNRNFIRDALRAAAEDVLSDPAIDDADRPNQIEIDHDTQGVPGSPAIAETILAKIDASDVFVADLTFVSDQNDRFHPNPNVLVEYGYALARLTNTRIIAVLNTVYGEPDILPFDLRHRRWPFTFHLPVGASRDARQKQSDALRRYFGMALKAIIFEPATSVVLSEFVAAEPKDGRGTFVMAGDTMCLQGETPVTIRGGPYAFLRVLPTSATEPLSHRDSAKIVRELLTMGGREVGGAVGRSEDGAVVYWSGNANPGQAEEATKLFRSKEIWAVSPYMLSITTASFPGKRLIPAESTQYSFKVALELFRKVARTQLNLPLPLQIEVGLVGAAGQYLGVSSRWHETRGPIQQNEILYSGVIRDWEEDVGSVLNPFFDAVYDAADAIRPA